MNCSQYIFLLTSDRLAQATLAQSVQARWHWIKCTRCRAFTRNDQVLMNLLDQRRQDEQRLLSPPDKS